MAEPADVDQLIPLVNHFVADNRTAGRLARTWMLYAHRSLRALLVIYGWPIAFTAILDIVLSPGRGGVVLIGTFGLAASLWSTWRGYASTAWAALAPGTALSTGFGDGVIALGYADGRTQLRWTHFSGIKTVGEFVVLVHSDSADHRFLPRELFPDDTVDRIAAALRQSAR